MGGCVTVMLTDIDPLSLSAKMLWSLNQDCQICVKGFTRSLLLLCTVKRVCNNISVVYRQGGVYETLLSVWNFKRTSDDRDFVVSSFWDGLPFNGTRCTLHSASFYLLLCENFIWDEQSNKTFRCCAKFKLFNEWDGSRALHVAFGVFNKG